MGFANYHRGFIAGNGHFYRFIGKKPFIGGPDGEFVLDTDTSAEAIGVELSQIQDGQEKPIAYGNLSLSAKQQRYCTTLKELLAVVRVVCMYRHNLLGWKFIVRTDHHSLIRLLSFRCRQTN